MKYKVIASDAQTVLAATRIRAEAMKSQRLAPGSVLTFIIEADDHELLVDLLNGLDIAVDDGTGDLESVQLSPSYIRLDGPRNRWVLTEPEPPDESGSEPYFDSEGYSAADRQNIIDAGRGHLLR